MKNLDVDNVIISKQPVYSNNYDEFVKIVKSKKIKTIIVNKGDRIQLDKDLYIDFLWPNNSNIIKNNELNNNSILCKLNYKSFSMLFTGDIEMIAENAILEEYSNTNILKATVLKVAHHGSLSSTTTDFLNAVLPKYALIGVGENNKFGHPNDEVLERLNSKGTKIYRTDLMGEISIKIKKDGKIKIVKYIN